MGRPKGGINRNYTIQEKEKIIIEAFELGISPTARKYEISKGMLYTWVKKYKDNG